MKTLAYTALVILALNMMGCKGDQGPVGPKGDTGAAGAAGVAGVTGAQGPKGESGVSSVVSTTWVFDRTTMARHVTGASLEVPAGFVKEPANFTGLFMAYLTPLDAAFTEYGAGVTFVMPHRYVDGGAGSTAFVYRSAFGGYYLRFDPDAPSGSPTNYSFLDSGRFSIRLVWVPSTSNARRSDYPDSEKGIQFVNGNPVNQPAVSKPE